MRKRPRSLDSAKKQALAVSWACRANFKLHNRVVLARSGCNLPSFQNLSGLSTDGINNFTSPTLGAVTCSETMLASGTVRARVGCAPGNWLLYGGSAWAYAVRT